MQKTVILLFIAISWVKGSVLDGFSLEEYFRMPLMTSYDHYDSCMHSATTKNPMYCVARTKIKPDLTSLTWNITKEFSDVKKLHFRHDVLTRGVCIETCLKTLSKGIPKGLDIENFNEEDFNHNPNNFKNTLKYRKELHHSVNICVNMKLKEQYNLTGYSTINHCDAKNDDYSYDSLDKFFVFLVLFIAITAISGTIYDIKYRKKKVEGQKSGTLEKVLMSFSLKANYERLVAQPSTKLNQDLMFVQALRYFTMLVVVYGHTDMGFNMNPTNPEYYESRFHDIVGQYFLNGTMVVQTFFIMSGGLLAVHFIDGLMTKKQFNMSYFWMSVIHRYIRLTPIYAVVLLFDATLLNKVNRGPFWKPIAEVERNVCRRNWYQNLFYVNNYLNVPNGCMVHTWYLAADTQLFVFGMIVMMVVWKFQKYKKIIVGAVLTVALVIPGIVTYVNKFEGAFIAPPENKREITWMPEFRYLYIPAYMNAGSYVIGMVAGFLVHQFHQKTPDVRTKRLLGYMFWLVPILGVLNLQASNIFYFFDFEKPAIWISVFSIFSRIIWGLLGFVLIFSAIFKASFFINKFFNAPIFQPLGRITYCIYLVHVPLMRVLAGDNKGVLHISHAYLASSVTFCFLLSTIVGGMLCLTVELPMMTLVKMLFGSKEQEVEKNIEVEIQLKEEESAIKIDVERHDYNRETREI